MKQVLGEIMKNEVELTKEYLPEIYPKMPTRRDLWEEIFKLKKELETAKIHAGTYKTACDEISDSFEIIKRALEYGKEEGYYSEFEIKDFIQHATVEIKAKQAKRGYL